MNDSRSDALVFFGATGALQFRFQALGFALPHQVLLALPYALTLLCLVGLTGRSRAPAALGQPYVRD